MRLDRYVIAMIKLHGLLVAALLTLGAPSVASPPKSVFLEDLTTSEVRARLDTSCQVGIIFNGGGEETGPAVALGKHIFRARAYSEAIARNIGDAIVAPIQPFAPNGEPDPFAEFAGSIAISNATFAALNEQIARSLIGGGFKRVALLGDHGGGQRELEEIAARLDAEFIGKGIRVFYISDGYSKARRQIEAEGVAAGRPAGGHGGLWDTAETLAVKPDAVRMDKLAAGDISNGGNGQMNAAGFSGDPRPSTVALGKYFGAIRVRMASDELRVKLAAAGPCVP